jgi:hypothetical protein
MIAWLRDNWLGFGAVVICFAIVTDMLVTGSTRQSSQTFTRKYQPRQYWKMVGGTAVMGLVLLFLLVFGLT